MASASTVSYTHLDVYKRQEEGGEGGGGEEEEKKKEETRKKTMERIFPETTG